MRFEEYAEEWISRRHSQGQRSAADYESVYRNHIEGLFKNRHLKKTKRKHVRKYAINLSSKRKGDGSEYAARTLRKVIAVLHNIFEDAVYDEMIPHNPVKLRGSDMPKVIRKKGNPMAREHAEMLMAETEDPLWAFLLFTGCRIGEALAMTWEDIDFDRDPLGCITISKSWSSVRREVGPTKTSTDREVPIHFELGRVLYPLQGEGLVFPSKTKGKHQLSSTVRARLARDLKRLGLPRHRTHDTRHTFVTLSKEDGAGEALRRVTHAPRGDAHSGYHHPSWPTTCSEMAMLKLIASPDNIALAA